MVTKAEAATKYGIVILLFALARKLDKKLALRLPFLTASLMGAILYKIRARKQQKGIAETPGRVPILGHLLSYENIREHPVEGILEWSRENNFQTFISCLPFNTVEVILHDEKDREYILKTNFSNFNKNYDFQFGFDRLFHDLLGAGIFNVDGDRWKMHRKIASHLFTGKNIGVIMTEVFVQHAEIFKSAMNTFAEENTTFDIQLLFQSLVFDAFCQIAFGTSPNSFEAAIKGEKEQFQASFDAAQQITSDRAFDLPFVRDFKYQFGLGDESKLQKHMAVINDYIANIIKTRESEINAEFNIDTVDNTTQKDMLGLYIYYAKKLQRPDLLTHSYLRDVIMNFMIAGRDTTSCVLTNIFSLMAENAEVEAKLVEQISEKIIKSENSVENFVKNEIKDFPLADAVFSEALRMYPSVSNDFRITTAADELPSGIKLNPGTVVTIPNHSIGRNPKYWEKPDEFIPERWLVSTGDSTVCRRIDEYRSPFFWGGYRICLGQHMARAEGKIMTCLLLHSFKFEIVRPREEKFVNGPVMFYSDGVHFKVTKRNSA